MLYHQHIHPSADIHKVSNFKFNFKTELVGNYKLGRDDLHATKRTNAHIYTNTLTWVNCVLDSHSIRIHKHFSELNSICQESRFLTGKDAIKVVFGRLVYRRTCPGYSVLQLRWVPKRSKAGTLVRTAPTSCLSTFEFEDFTSEISYFDTRNNSTTTAVYSLPNIQSNVGVCANSIIYKTCEIYTVQSVANVVELHA